MVCLDCCWSYSNIFNGSRAIMNVRINLMTATVHDCLSVSTKGCLLLPDVTCVRDRRDVRCEANQSIINLHRTAILCVTGFYVSSYLRIFNQNRIDTVLSKVNSKLTQRRCCLHTSYCFLFHLSGRACTAY